MRIARFPGLRRPVSPALRPVAKPFTFPAPVAGWVTNTSLVKPRPMSAQKLVNFFPTATGLSLRGGSVKRATIGTDPVESFITYNASGTRKIWACDETNIFDVTSPADPDTPPVADVTGQTSGYYSYVNFTTSGSSYVVAVNGTDLLLLYDGATWVPIDDMSSPAITGVATSTLSHVWKYRNRLFFIGAGMDAHFLPVDSIGGALGTVSLAGIFQMGGSLLFGATWSLDAGDGIDDKCVFVTTEGEAAIFEGSNPAGTDVADWNLVGRYDLTAPMGKRATLRAGGDLVIATKEGLVPISAAINKDAAALSLASISQAIEPDWKVESAARVSLPWEIVKWPEKNRAIVSLPIAAASDEPWQFVVNLQTGAWTKFSGWPARCMDLHDARLFYGTDDGEVFEGEVGGSDDGEPIYYACVGNPDPMKAFGQLKTIHQARATFSSATPYAAAISFAVNYKADLPAPPSSVDGGDPANLWDTGLWDVCLWDGESSPAVIETGEWISIGVTGYVVQYQLQITGLLAITPDTEFIQLDATYETGGVVV